MIAKLDEKNRELYCYSSQYKSTNRLSDRLIEKAADIFSHEVSYDECSFRSRACSHKGR